MIFNRTFIGVQLGINGSVGSTVAHMVRLRLREQPERKGADPFCAGLFYAGHASRTVARTVTIGRRVGWRLGLNGIGVQ